MLRSPAEVQKYRTEKEVTIVQGAEKVGNPIVNFQECGFPDYFVNAFQADKFVEPTAIQAQGWPIALKG